MMEGSKPLCMTNEEAIAACREGRRAITEHTLHQAAKDFPGCQHIWRTIACDYETDVIECSRCGYQRAAKCDFEDDFA